MEGRADASLSPGRQLTGVSPGKEVLIDWLKHLLHGNRSDDALDNHDSIALRLEIGRVREVGMVDAEWRRRVRRGQPHATPRASELQAGRDPEEPRAELFIEVL